MNRFLAALCVSGSLLVACGGGTQNAAGPPSPPPVLAGGARTTGLYAVETTPDGAAFRWTNGDAVIDGPVQSGPVHAVRLTLYAFAPTKTRVTVDGETLADRTIPGGNTELGGVLMHPAKKPVVRITSATFVPAGGDRRLGVQLRALSYVGDVSQIDLAGDAVSPATLTGVYPIESDTNGHYRWTNGDATITLPGSVHGPLTLSLNAFNETAVTVTVDGAQRKTLLVHGAARVTVALHRGPNVIRIESPSFTPPPVNGYTRTLGVEITGLRSGYR